MRGNTVGVAIGMAAMALATLGGCMDDHARTGAPLAGGLHAVAMLRDATGKPVGRATATEVGGGLRITIDTGGLPAGTHGVHVHAVGACDAPGFTTAGPHWNPTMRQHGGMNPNGPHEGDLPNLIIGTNGRGSMGVVIAGATMAGLLDADGAAMVVHAGPDDLMTDPSGNSGARIACGVFAAG